MEGGGFPVDIPYYPRISNDRPIEEILEFIADKSVIISATFHGIYWSQLMSKKVLYYNYDNLVNSKYLNIKHRVDICTKDNYLEKIYNISSTEGFKEECRLLNDNFHKEVIKLLWSILGYYFFNIFSFCLYKEESIDNTILTVNNNLRVNNSHKEVCVWFSNWSKLYRYWWHIN